MINRLIAAALLACMALAFIAWRLHVPDEVRPLVCQQLSPGAKYARQCSPSELSRAREAYRWIIENAPPLPSVVLAGVASFIEDTGRHKRTKFFQLLIRHDIDGACEQMMAHINRRGKPDPERILRRGHERALCLSKG